MSALGKTGVRAWVTRKQAMDVSLIVSFAGVVYLLEVGSESIKQDKMVYFEDLHFGGI